MVMNLEDMDKVAVRQGDEAERKRKAKVAEIKRDTEKRRAAAAAQEQRQREAERERVKAEVKSFYLAHNLWAVDADFEKAWSADPERLVREHRAVLSGIQRM